MVNFEDQDWEELGAQARRGALDAANAWKIVVGVAIGMLLGGGLVYLVDHGIVQRGVSDAVRAYQQTMRVAGPTSASPPKAAGSAAGQFATQQDRPGPGSTEPEPQAPPTGSAGEAESAQRASLQAAEQKERAWARYYKKAAQCDGNPGRDTIVECANDFIRARREFEAAYAAGKR